MCAAFEDYVYKAFSLGKKLREEGTGIYPY